jgi:hypothetical protein
MAIEYLDIGISAECDEHNDKSTQIGRKFDSGKPRWELLPYKELEEIVEIFTFGAKKYSQKLELDSSSMLSFLEEELEQWNTVPNAIKIELFLHEGCVDHATINSLKNRILNMPRDNEKTGESGNKTTPISLLSIGNVDAQTQRREQRIEELNEQISLNAEALQKTQLHFFYKSKRIDAQFATETLAPVPCILTMTLKQASQEDTYVVGATTVLECLVMIFQVLRKQLNIFKTLQEITIQENIAILNLTGDDNWMHVTPFRKRYIGALMRHITAWIRGEKTDPETSKSHLAHAGCCLLFLMWGDNNLDKDR